MRERRPGGGRESRTAKKLAPSIRRADDWVRWGWYASIVHAVGLLALGVGLLTGDDPRLLLGIVSLLGAAVVPWLGRSAYLGNSFRAFLLLAIVIVPVPVAYLTSQPIRIPLLFLLLAPIYLQAVKGATQLRGRRRGGGGGR